MYRSIPQSPTRRSSPPLLAAFVFASALPLSAQRGPTDPPPPPRVDEPAAPLLQLGEFALLDLSLDTLFSVGSSTANDAELEFLQAGGHDPRQRGFNLQNVELGLRGRVDDWLGAEAYLVLGIDPIDGETTVELEEAFVKTIGLGSGFEVEVGHMSTEFGLHNPLHPHDWQFLDAPVILARLFGPDGLRAPGARVGWRPPLPWSTTLHLGVQNARGETMASFLANDELYAERPVGGRAFTDRRVRNLGDLVWLLRLEQSWRAGRAGSIQFGASALFGPNATGEDAATRIYGADLAVRWTDDHGCGHGHGHGHGLTWTTEVLRREFDAAAFTSGSTLVPGSELVDQGAYTQLVYDFDSPWSVGLRYEHTIGSGDSWDGERLVSHDLDPLRDRRSRITPMLAWRASESTRLRLQYAYDDARHLDEAAHTVWLGIEVSLGSHPVHGP